MSETTPPALPPTPAGTADDKITTVSRLTNSLVSQFIFLAALCVAWWTKSEMLGILLGIAATNATSALNFWFGTSAGSVSKGKTQAALLVPPVSSTTTTIAPSGATTTSTTGPVSR